MALLEEERYASDEPMGPHPVGTMLGWALVVDRGALTGAVARPEEFVESSWYDKAALGAFHDLLIMIGLLVMALSIVPMWRDVPVLIVLLALWIGVAVDVFIRYRLSARRG